MSIDRLLSQYGAPITSWPGEEALDEEAKANLAAAAPRQLQTEGGATDAGSLLPITRYPPRVGTDPSTWKTAGDVLASLDDGWRLEPFNRISAPFQSMLKGLREQPLLGPMVRPSQMHPEAFDQMTGDAMSVAGAGVMGNIPRVLAGAPAGTIDFGMFGGRRGAEALAAKGEPRPLQALDMVEAMEKAGKSRDEIWQATAEMLKDTPYAGAFRGVDQKPKFEIDDSGSLTKGLAKEKFHNEYDNGRTGLSVDARAAARSAADDLRARISRGEITKEAAETEYQAVRAQHQATIDRGREIEAIGDRLRDRGVMPEVFHHPEVYAAYPDIARVRGDMRSDSIAGARGEWVPGNNVASSKINLSSEIDNPQRRSTALHEIQHGIQELEGFGVGTNPALARDMPEATALLEERTARAAAEYRRAMDEYRANPTAGNKHAAERASSALAQIGTVPGGKEALEVYLRHAGEVEARTVQARRDLSPDERRARPPWMDDDVPKKDQIVRFGGDGQAASIDLNAPHPIDKLLDEVAPPLPAASVPVPASLDPLGYYSAAAEAARGLKQLKGTPEQMLAQLKKAGARDAEIEATGLLSFLGLERGSDGVARRREDVLVPNRPQTGRTGEGQRGQTLGSSHGQQGPAGRNSTQGGLSSGSSAYSKYDADPATLTYREAEQNNLDGVRDYFPQGEGYYPAVVIRGRDGISILDGHNRARVAEERGERLPVVEITDAQYQAAKRVAGDDIDVAHAALEMAGEDDAASGLRAKFPGASMMRDYYKIIDAMESAANQKQAKPRLVTRGEIIKHLEGNRVGLSEAEYRKTAPTEYEVYGDDPQKGRYFGADRAAAEAYARETGMDIHEISLDTDATRWSSYSLDPSNPTYRETVLHLPSTMSKERQDNLALSQYGRSWSDLSDNQRRILEQSSHGIGGAEDVNFRSGHFSEPNIVGHMMTSETRLPLEVAYPADKLADIGQRIAKAVGAKDVKDVASGAMDTAVRKGVVTKDEASAWIFHRFGNRLGHDPRPKVFTLDQIQSDWGQKIESDTREALAQRLFGKGFKQLSPDERKQVSAAKSDGDKPAGVRDEAKIAELRQGIAAQKKNFDDALALASNLAGGKLTGESALSWLSYAASGGRADIQDQARLLQSRLNAARQGIELRTAELRTAEASTPGHPLVNTTDRWTNVVLRRALHQAAESNAEYIAIPSGRTVESYNPQGSSEGVDAFYDKIVPKNLNNILTSLDKKAPAPIRVETLDSPSGATGLGSGFMLFPLTPAIKERIIKGGQPLFKAGGAVLPSRVPDFTPAQRALQAAVPRRGARDANEILDLYSKD